MRRESFRHEGGHKPRAPAQRGFDVHERRPRVPPRPRDDECVPVGSLVRERGAQSFQGFGNRRTDDGPCGVGSAGVEEPDVHKADSAGKRPVEGLEDCVLRDSGGVCGVGAEYGGLRRVGGDPRWNVRADFYPRVQRVCRLYRRAQLRRAGGLKVIPTRPSIARSNLPRTFGSSESGNIFRFSRRPRAGRRARTQCWAFAFRAGRPRRRGRRPGYPRIF